MTNWQSKFSHLTNICERCFVILHSLNNIGGLYSCFDDWGICCFGCWCTACLYGENAVKIDGSDYDDACCTYCLSGQSAFGWIPIVDNRRALRNKYGLVEEPCDDCLVIICCGPCAVCQAARELNSRKNMPGQYFMFRRIFHMFRSSSACERILMKSLGTFFSM